MAYREFNVVAQPETGPTFVVLGHEFKCLPTPPAGILADIIISSAEEIGKQTAAIINLICGCLPDPQEEEFRLLIYSKDTIVPVETLAEVAEWLLEEYSKPRPTTPSSGSPSGSASSPAMSEGGASSPASTSEASTEPS